MSIGKNINFSLCIVALYDKAFLDDILNSSEFLTACATFLKPPCYVHLWQFFLEVLMAASGFLFPLTKFLF